MRLVKKVVEVHKDYLFKIGKNNKRKIGKNSVDCLNLNKGK